ncbi:MarR family winged helix-turn-helix transcriptional regulator [Nocardia sp. NPDC059764]|uniref:MarR family winged helix-turn-helix transcriptional regulator n=1 Tax=Nocardia sp. NPDC059764 TaxID=3346939 RepID=UPI003657EAC2
MAEDPAFRPLGRLYRIAALWKAQLAPVLKQHGLNAASFHVLVTLRRADAAHSLTTSQLAALDMVTCSGMTVRADKLERAGLITRERDEQDRRIIHLRLTEYGLDLTDRLLAHYHTTEQQLLATLDADEHLALERLVSSLERSLHRDADGPIPAQRALRRTSHRDTPSSRPAGSATGTTSDET